MAVKRADAAPGTGGQESVDEEREKLQVDDAAKLPKPVITPPPAPGLEEESAWIAAKPVNSWIDVTAQDTRDGILEQIGRSVLARFNADADLAVGHAVTTSWIDNQLAVYSLPITLDDVKAKTRSVLETNGVEVREG